MERLTYKSFCGDYGLNTNEDLETMKYKVWNKLGEFEDTQEEDEERFEKIFRIADHYGFENQRAQAQEECAELIQALSKDRRGMCTNLAEEIADVQIMLWQLMCLKNMETSVYQTIDEKLDRQIERMERGV